MKKKILLEEAENSHLLLPSKSLKNKNSSFYKEKIKSNEQRKKIFTKECRNVKNALIPY